MDQKHLHDEMIGFAKKMKANIDKQTQLLNIKLNELTPEKREHFAKEQAEMNRAVKIAEKGDVKELNKLIEKYANTSFNR